MAIPSADLRREDARFSTSTSKFTLERYGSLAGTERAQDVRAKGLSVMGHEPSPSRGASPWLAGLDPGPGASPDSMIIMLV